MQTTHGANHTVVFRGGTVPAVALHPCNLCRCRTQRVRSNGPCACARSGGGGNRHSDRQCGVPCSARRGTRVIHFLQHTRQHLRLLVRVCAPTPEPLGSHRRGAVGAGGPCGHHHPDRPVEVCAAGRVLCGDHGHALQVGKRLQPQQRPHCGTHRPAAAAHGQRHGVAVCAVRPVGSGAVRGTCGAANHHRAAHMAAHRGV